MVGGCVARLPVLQKIKGSEHPEAGCLGESRSLDYDSYGCKRTFKQVQGIGLGFRV